jgi:hypothetical protein
LRSLQVFIITLCFGLGLFLLSGRGFFMPDRWNPAFGVQLGGLSSRLLGSGLLLIAYLGVIARRTFTPGALPRLSTRWQWTYFGALLLAMALISAAFLSGERGPTPGRRAPPAAQSGSP